MVQYFQEVTTKGDSYGKKKSQKGKIILTASRTFIIRIDTASDRSITEVYSLLPKIGNVHPYVPYCFVSDIKVSCNEDDPHIYTAVVEYESPEPNTGTPKPDPYDHPEETDVEYPWDNPAQVVFNSDSSQTQAMDFAYTRWPHALSITPITNIVSGSKEEDTYPKYQIVNQPFLEKPLTIPEEPIDCLALDASFSIKGFAGTSFRKHIRKTVLDLKAEYFTVNNVPVTLFGYTFNPYCGYVSDISMESKYFLTERGGIYAYYDVRLRILDNPNTWIRRVMNMSLNTYKVDPNTSEKTKSHIMLKDAYTGLTSKITEPVPIHPSTGIPMSIDENGLPITENDIAVYVLPFLTKKPSFWMVLSNICNAVEARA